MNEAAFFAIYKDPYSKRQVVSWISFFNVTRINQMPKIFAEYIMFWFYVIALLVFANYCGK